MKNSIINCNKNFKKCLLSKNIFFSNNCYAQCINLLLILLDNKNLLKITLGNCEKLSHTLLENVYSSLANQRA